MYGNFVAIGSHLWKCRPINCNFGFDDCCLQRRRRRRHSAYKH